MGVEAVKLNGFSHLKKACKTGPFRTQPKTDPTLFDMEDFGISYWRVYQQIGTYYALFADNIL